ncbi:hypothetical protein N0V82_002095 [Gnomoniopsis sp. IMI 355080]|nr:hypothetical protein N0V82_002095 [Gnomoniopsis sp. IMI 355080]
MQMTGLHHRGFVIYRCDDSNDNHFDKSIYHLRKEVDAYHQRAKQDLTTGLYPRWAIVQHREIIDGATKYQARQRFVEWRASSTAFTPARTAWTASGLMRTLWRLRSSRPRPSSSFFRGLC